MPRPLPTELIRHIIKLALPVVSYSTYMQRYDLLLACSLVNSTWSALAREELYREVFVDTGEELDEVLEGRENQFDRRVHLGAGGNADDIGELGGFPAALDGIKTLSMSLFVVEAHDWRPLEDLETLHLYTLDLGRDFGHHRLPGPSQLPDGCLFRSLTTLSLFNVYLTSTFPRWTTWFTPTNFPQLCRLTIGTMGTSTSLGRVQDFIQALELLAPQIQDLTFTEGYRSAIIFADFPWSAFTTIQRLALFSQAGDPPSLFDAALAELPAPALSHLLVGYGHGFLNKQSQPLSVWETKLLPTLAQALEARSEVDSLRALEVLVLHYGNEAVERGTLETSSQFEAVMKARGGVLERRVGWGQREEMLEWERYLEVW